MDHIPLQTLRCPFKNAIRRGNLPSYMNSKYAALHTMQPLLLSLPRNIRIRFLSGEYGMLAKDL